MAKKNVPKRGALSASEIAQLYREPFQMFEQDAGGGKRANRGRGGCKTTRTNGKR